MPSGKRKEPGSTGQGDYYHIEVTQNDDFKIYRYQDVGDPGKILRLAGKRDGGTWEDKAWLIDKKMAHINRKTLIGDHKDAKELLEKVKNVKHLKGDIFSGTMS